MFNFAVSPKASFMRFKQSSFVQQSMESLENTFTEGETDVANPNNTNNIDEDENNYRLKQDNKDKDNDKDNDKDKDKDKNSKETDKEKDSAITDPILL